MESFELDREIDVIIESVLCFVPAVAIYLFGSYAYGTPHRDSDIDIYIVVPDETTDISERYTDIRMAMKGKRFMPLDMLIGKVSRFNKRKNGPTLERVIAEKGRVLYEG